MTSPAPEIARLLSRLDPELWIVTAADSSRRGGLVATFVNSASIAVDCPRVLVGIARQHFTWELIESADAFALHLIGEEHLDWVWRFGLASGRDTDKFENLSVRTAPMGSPILTEAVGWLDCRVEDRLETGDRTVYLAEVVAGELLRDEAPLTVGRLLKRTPPDKLAQLKVQLNQDAQIDAAAIRGWRIRTNPRKTAP